MLAGEEVEAAPQDALATLSPSPAATIARVLGELRMILAGPSIQVRCLTCPPSPRPESGSDDRGLWAWLSRG